MKRWTTPRTAHCDGGALMTRHELDVACQGGSMTDTDLDEAAGLVAPALYDAYAAAVRAAVPEAELASWDELATIRHAHGAHTGAAARSGWLAAAMVAVVFAQMTADAVPGEPDVKIEVPGDDD